MSAIIDDINAAIALLARAEAALLRESEEAYSRGDNYRGNL